MAGCFVFHCADLPSEQRVRLVECSTLHAAILLFPEGGVVPTQAEVKRQPPGDLPAVLNVYSVGVHAQPHIRRGRRGRGIGQAEKEAGITESAALGVLEGVAVLPGVASLYGGECKLSISAAFVQALDALKQRRRPQLIGMVSLDPGQIGVEGRLVVVCDRGESEGYACVTAARKPGAAGPAAAIETVHARH